VERRIFTRIRTFTGRNDIQFRTFLSYYVLKDLFLEWRRTRREIETISLNTPLGDPTESDRVLEDILPDTVEIEEVGSKSKSLAAEVWSFLDPEKRLCLKLLYLIECNLGSEDIRLLASLSGRSIRDTLILVAEVQEGLKRKDERLSRLRDELDSVWGWILLRQRELQEIDKKILLMTEEGNSSGKDDLVTQKEKLEKNITKRHRQRERIVESMHKCKLTTPYKDIARLLNTTRGTVCSLIFRCRTQLAQEFEEKWALEERAP
jgi:hypothetical protein